MVDSDTMADDSEDTMKDVSHTARYGGGVDAVWKRGADPETDDE